MSSCHSSSQCARRRRRSVTGAEKPPAPDRRIRTARRQSRLPWWSRLICQLCGRELRSHRIATLIHPDLKSPRLLGWDDDAHFRRHVFRWDEVVLLNQVAASSPEGFPAVLQLIRFAAAPSSELRPTPVSIVMSGLHATGEFPETGLEATARDLLSYYMPVPVTWHENTELGPVPIEQPGPSGRIAIQPEGADQPRVSLRRT